MAEESVLYIFSAIEHSPGALRRDRLPREREKGGDRWMDGEREGGRGGQGSRIAVPSAVSPFGPTPPPVPPPVGGPTQRVFAFVCM